MILPTIVGTFDGLNHFSHLIYMLLTSMYQNIAKLLTNLSNFIYIISGPC